MNMGEKPMTADELFVSRLEALPAGAPFADAAEDAAAAVAEARSHARLAIFPAMEAPQAAGVYAAYAHHISGIAGPLHVGMIELHREALTVSPALAELLRGKRARADVLGLVAEQRKGVFAGPLPNAARHLDFYEKEIARQLADLEDHELTQAARAFLAVLALEKRLADEIADRQNSANQELATLERIRQEEDAAMERETSRRASTLKAAEEAHRQAIAQVQLSEAKLIQARIAGGTEEDHAEKPKAKRGDGFRGWEPGF